MFPTAEIGESRSRTTSYASSSVRIFYRKWITSTGICRRKAGTRNIPRQVSRLLDTCWNEEETSDMLRPKAFISLLLVQGVANWRDNCVVKCKYPNIPKSKTGRETPSTLLSVCAGSGHASQATTDSIVHANSQAYRLVLACQSETWPNVCLRAGNGRNQASSSNGKKERTWLPTGQPLLRITGRGKKKGGRMRSSG